MVVNHLAEHEAALCELVNHPNQLEVRRTAFPDSVSIAITTFGARATGFNYLQLSVRGRTI